MRSASDRRAPVTRWAALAVVLPFLLAACGGQSALHAGDHTVFVHGRSVLPAGGFDALVEGTLTVRDGCVLIAQDDDVAFPVIWPSGTSIAREDPLVLELPSGEELAVGQTVRGGGGYHDVSSDRVEVTIPAECLPETGEVAVFNPDDRPSVRE